jgi:hypothetical protein
MISGPTATDLDWAPAAATTSKRLTMNTIDANTPLVRRIGAVNWDCSMPSDTFFGKATTHTLGPAKWRDRTPYYAEVVGEDRIEHHYRTLEEYETEMRYAIDAGIDYFAYCWFDPAHHPDDKTKSAGHLHELIRARQMHVQSALRERLSICAILVTYHPYSDECLRELAEEMKNPWYENVDGRPLVYMFASTRTVAPRLRAICREVGLSDPYAVSMLYDPPNKLVPTFENADALCAYACTEDTPTGGEYAAMSVLWNTIRTTAGLPVVAQFSLGWDPTPRIERPNPWSNYPRRDYAPPLSREEMLDEAKMLRVWIERNQKECPTGHVMVSAWNEFEEGCWICPNIGPDGRPDDSRVRAFREVVEVLKGAKGSSRPVERSTPLQDAPARRSRHDGSKE